MAYFKLLFISCLLGVSQAVIDSSLIKSLRSGGVADVLVNFKGDNINAIQAVNEQGFRTRLSKVVALSSALHALANETQAPVKRFLKGKHVKSQSFWSSNQMVIRSANLVLLQGVDSFSQVKRIQKLPVIKLSPKRSRQTPKAENVEWGVSKILADQVWSSFNTTGVGVVVANIDTGVRGTHEALAGNWRSDHGWYDPYTNLTFPGDQNGHGSHTMFVSDFFMIKRHFRGTIVGSGGIGIVPGARWIACRGCGSSSCDAEQLLACGQWMLSPTNPDGSDPQPSLIPDVISNSWGSNVGGDTWYNATVEAWTAAGIMHAFALGNSGPACRSAGSPGDQTGVFSVGSTDKNDKLSIFSSKGPAGDVVPYIKPDISAPGSNIRSAWYDSDTSYNTISGTSMATPHVAGVLALMISAYRAKVGDKSANLNFPTAVANIEKTADTQNLTVSFPNYRCDGSFFGKMKFPNNQFGYGRINALGAVNATLNS